MQTIINGIIIEYELENKTLVNKIMKQLEIKSPKILNFFGLDEIKDFKIKIWNDIDAFKTYFEQVSDGEKYQDWIIAHTYDDNINLLSIEIITNILNRKNETEENIAIYACHEFTHICQKQINSDSNEFWFWEALALNFGNPESCINKSANFNEIPNMQFLEENFDNLPNKHQYCYLLGKYMLDNIDHKTILEYVKYPNKLHKDREQILIDTKKYCKKYDK